MTTMTPAEYGAQMGGKRRGVPVKTLKKILKKAGLKTTGKKAALTRRAKKAKLVKKGGKGDEGMMVDTSQINEVKTVVDDAKKAEEDATIPAEPTKGGAGHMNAMGGRKRKSRGKKGLYGMGMGMY